MLGQSGAGGAGWGGSGPHVGAVPPAACLPPLPTDVRDAAPQQEAGLGMHQSPVPMLAVTRYTEEVALLQAQVDGQKLAASRVRGSRPAQS